MPGSLKAESTIQKNIKVMISELYENLVQEERLTITQIKFVYTNFEETLWPRAVVAIISKCEPKLIPDSQLSDLFKTYKANKSAVSSNNQTCGGTLGPILDEIPRNHFETLGAFLAYVRDFSQDVVHVTKVLGKIVLGNQKEAKDLFLLMVENAEPLFGRIATPRTVLGSS